MADNRRLDGELAELLVGIQRLLRRRLRLDSGRPRLRGAQTELLRLVAAQPGIRVSAAAQELFLAGNSVSTLVNQLSAAGYLRREPDPADRRAALLYATDDARERLDEWQRRRLELVGRHLDALSAEDRAALTAALPALHRLAEGLRHEDQPTQPPTQQPHHQPEEGD